MHTFFRKAKLIGLTIVVSVGFVASVIPTDTSAQVTSLYGRPPRSGYFTGATSGGQPYACGGSGYLICSGIGSNGVQEFLEFYYGHLFGGDTQGQRAAAFTILAMLGVDGPSTGGANNGVNMARARFGEWDARVRSYGAAGRIDFNNNFSFGTNTAYRSGDVHWRNDPDTAISIVFTLLNGSHVAIKKSCANLVGAAYLPPIDYNLSASSSANISSATPGQGITWNHTLQNLGSGPTSQNTYSHLGMSGFTNGWGTGLSAANTPAGAGIGAIRGWDYNVYGVTQNDVGNTLCQWVEFDPTNSSGGRHGRSSQACVNVPFNYSLMYQITNITPGQMMEGDAGDIPVQGRVTNNGPTKSHTNIRWQVTQIRYVPGVNIPHLDDTDGGTSPVSVNPCSYFNAASAVCTVLSSGTEGAGYGSTASVGYPATGNLGDVPVGTRLCYAMSVQRASSITEYWGHSRLYCIVVGKKPKIQVYGGDVIVGRGYDSAGARLSSRVITSTSTKGGLNYGSWGEYGIIPSGQIVGMASASGYAVGIPTNNPCSTEHPLSLLSFSNATGPAASASCSASNIGNYSLTSPSQLDAVTARFIAPTGAPTLSGNVNVTDLATKTIYTGTGTINLSASADIPAGKWVIINAPNATVRITGNIRYSNDVITSARNLPQLVIIARNINIADSVSNVDAWLYARGTTSTTGVINTCDAVVTASGLNSRICNNQLTINGPVIANRLLLHRTHGSDVGAESSTPAEVFNLRPDAYMWASSFSGVGTKARTVITTELPPRF